MNHNAKLAAWQAFDTTGKVTAASESRTASETYELVYSSGGTGGPYHSLNDATKAAERILKGGSDYWIAVVPAAQIINLRTARPEMVLHRTRGWQKTHGMSLAEATLDNRFRGASGPSSWERLTGPALEKFYAVFFDGDISNTHVYAKKYGRKTVFIRDSGVLRLYAAGDDGHAYSIKTYAWPDDEMCLELVDGATTGVYDKKTGIYRNMRLHSGSSRTAGFSIEFDDAWFAFVGNAPFNIDTIRAIGKIVIPFTDVEGTFHDEGDAHTVGVLSHNYSGPLTYTQEKQGLVRETIAHIQFPASVAPRTLLQALQAVGRQFKFKVEALPGFKKPETRRSR